MLKSADINVNYEDVSYDVKSAFTSILVAETIEYILKKVYFWEIIHKNNKRISTLLLIKQIDGCDKGGLISLAFLDIYMWNITLWNLWNL